MPKTIISESLNNGYFVFYRDKDDKRLYGVVGRDITLSNAYYFSTLKEANDYADYRNWKDNQPYDIRRELDNQPKTRYPSDP